MLCIKRKERKRKEEKRIPNSKNKGDITELQCLLALAKLGIQVSIPFGDNARYDLIADFNGTLSKIQCKTSRGTEDKIEFDCSSSLTNSKGTSHKDYHGEIDYFMTSFNNIAYLIPISDCGTRMFSMRLTPCKNGQVKGISFAKDYELENFCVYNSMVE